MEEKFGKFKDLMAEVADLNHAAALMGWDQQVNMPPGGADGRGHAMATVSTLAHQKATAPELGRLIEELKPWAETLDPDSYDRRMIQVAARDYEKQARVPAEFVAEAAQVQTVAFQTWQEARAKDDFSIFQPALEKVVELTQRYVTFFPPADHPYDVLLDDYEPGMKTAEVKGIFDALRPKQVELIKAIAARPQVDDSFLHQAFPEKEQWDFGVEVITRFGYDWKRGRQDKAPHPFTQGLGVDDVRITTRVDPKFFNTMFFGTLHEAGHAIYGQGIHHSLNRTPLAGGASLAIHESQSRFWENIIGRSRPMWEYFFPLAQKYFPAQLDNVTLDQFYKGINKVQPSLIRVEADEATYNLHIMLRLELEIAMVEGAVAIKDLPTLWNTKMQEYLGVVPPNNAKGVLQDIHWSNGFLGYFSTYALGNLISAQLWERYLTAVDAEVEDQIRQGDFSALFSWLHIKIHQYGRANEPQELVERVTKAKISPEPYLRYLTKKYSDIYGL
jgi:carboxypeptidase Taq